MLITSYKNKKPMMSKHANQTRTFINRLSALFVAGMMLAMAGNLVMPPGAGADSIQDQINALNSQNDASRAQVAQLGAQASSYQDQINKLQQQIDSLQAEITAAQAQVTQLQAEIAAKQAELNHQKQLLGDDIRQMYVEGQISTLEMLASSKNLSDFVDREVYRNNVQKKISDTLNQITQIQNQLKGQEDTLNQTIRDQQTAENQVATQQAAQNSLLSANQDQQNTINSQISSTNGQIATLRMQQLAANNRLGGTAVAGDPGHGGYPGRWDYPVPQDSLIDSWGMYNRECVSYTAWKVYQTYGYMPYWGGVGNANQWPGDAQAYGIPTGTTPRVHSVAISMSGAYGHAMWVEAVNGSTIWVSQYNQQLNGLYSEMSVDTSTHPLIFIYF